MNKRTESFVQLNKQFVKADEKSQFIDRFFSFDSFYIAYMRYSILITT